MLSQSYNNARHGQIMDASSQYLILLIEQHLILLNTHRIKLNYPTDNLLRHVHTIIAATTYIIYFTMYILQHL